MSDKMYDLRDMLEEELDRVAEKGTITREALEFIDKLTHSIKSIDTILAMQEAGYSNDDYSYEGGYSDARGRGRNAKRDSRGRYSSERGMYPRRSYEGRSYARSGRDGYSGHDDMMSMLEDMMEDSTDSRERDTIKKMMDRMR